MTKHPVEGFHDVVEKLVRVRGNPGLDCLGGLPFRLIRPVHHSS